MGKLAWLIVCLLINILIVGYNMHKDEKDQLERQISTLEAKVLTLENILSEVFQEKFDLDRLKVDEVTVSAYSSEKSQCDNDPYETSTGVTVSTNCIATSRDLPIAKHKHLLAIGIGTLRNEDTMNKDAKKALDLWMPDKTAAKKFGVKKGVRIMWLEGE